MRRRVAVAILCVMTSGIVLAVATPASAQSAGTVPEEFDEELAVQLQTELLDMLEAQGIDVDPANLNNVLGFPGDFDLKPGELILERTIENIGLAAIPPPTEGGGVKMEGPCMGLTMSYDDKGHLIDYAADFDPVAAPIDMLESDLANDDYVLAFTSDNPYKVDVNGFVIYAGIAGSRGDGPRNHRWFIKVQGLNVDSGGDPNERGKFRNAGAVDLKNDLPAAAKINAMFKIFGEMKADNGFLCTGSGFFQTTGGLPLLEGIGLVMIFGAGVGALFNVRPARTWGGA
jgi:hypothetical protein